MFKIYCNAPETKDESIQNDLFFDGSDLVNYLVYERDFNGDAAKLLLFEGGYIIIMRPYSVAAELFFDGLRTVRKQFSLKSMTHTAIESINGSIEFNVDTFRVSSISFAASHQTALRNFETSASDDFNYHRDKHENVALQLLFRATASAEQVPVFTTLAMIDDLYDNLGDRLCLQMNRGIEYFQFIDEIAEFWVKQHIWQTIPIGIDRINELDRIPSIFVNRFVGRVNAMQAKDHNIVMHSMQFNARINTSFRFSGERDLQILQINMKDYLIIEESHGTVDASGLISLNEYPL